MRGRLSKKRRAIILAKVSVVGLILVALIGAFAVIGHAAIARAPDSVAQFHAALAAGDSAGLLATVDESARDRSAPALTSAAELFGSGLLSLQSWQEVGRYRLADGSQYVFVVEVVVGPDGSREIWATFTLSPRGTVMQVE